MCRMEWMLQVADEFDDAFGAMRMLAMSWGNEIAMLAAFAAATAQREVSCQRREIH
jgi:hypothetical protein